MLGVIGTSYSAELMLKDLYENIIGRFSGWTAGHQLADEDRYAYRVAEDYGRFIHVYPWYEYRFAARLGGLWTELPLWGAHPIRKWERKLFLSLEYGVKAVYATLIELATRAAYDPQDDRMQFVATGWTDSLAAAYPSIATRARLDAHYTLLAAPRYDAFRDLLLALARTHARVRVTEIAGNDDILVTGVAPAGWHASSLAAQVVYSLPLPSDPRYERIALRVKVPLLDELCREPTLDVDHIYDY